MAHKVLFERTKSIVDHETPVWRCIIMERNDEDGANGIYRVKDVMEHCGGPAQARAAFLRFLEERLLPEELRSFGETFECRFDNIIGEEYDFDNDRIASPLVIAAMIELVQSMPVHRKTPRNNSVHYAGWCEREQVYIDFWVINGNILHSAFCGSENLMEVAAAMPRSACTPQPIA